MRKCFLFLAVSAIACSSSPSTTTGPTSTGTSGSGGNTGSGGAGGTTGGAGGTSGGAGGSTGGTGGNTGGTAGSGGTTGGAAGTSGGAGGNTGGTGGNMGGSAGAIGGSAGSTGGKGGSAGSAGSSGSGGSTTGGTAGSPDAGRDASAGAAGSGGGVDASTRDAAPDEMQACTAKAEAYCAKLQECSPFVMSVAFGNVATCTARWILNCTPTFGGSGTSATPARTTACAQSIPALACPTFLGGDLGTACAVAPGTVANGSPCGDDAQCVSTFCAHGPNALCGTCQPVTNAGDPCVQGSCSVSTNTVCPAGTSTCVKPKAGKVGDPCVGQEECDVGHQVGCNTATSKQCIALTLATGSCGVNNPLNPSSVAVCGSGGTCSGPFAGSCTGAAADGATCSTADTGAHCLPPARCSGSKCVVPDPSTCK